MFTDHDVSYARPVAQVNWGSSKLSKTYAHDFLDHLNLGHPQCLCKRKRDGEDDLKYIAVQDPKRPRHWTDIYRKVDTLIRIGGVHLVTRGHMRFNSFRGSRCEMVEVDGGPISSSYVAYETLLAAFLLDEIWEHTGHQQTFPVIWNLVVQYVPEHRACLTAVKSELRFSITLNLDLQSIFHRG